MNKIVRSICLFTKQAKQDLLRRRLDTIQEKLIGNDFHIQTRRICFSGVGFTDLENLDDGEYYLSIGAQPLKMAVDKFDRFASSSNIAFNLDCTDELDARHVEVLYRIIETVPHKTFSFAYTFSNVPSSPFFPSAAYGKSGFALGLQSTDLAAGSPTLDDWLARMATVWREITGLFAEDTDFLGIDSSVAPLFTGDSSLIHHIRRFSGGFDASVLSDIYTRITGFIKSQNPCPVGLCGLMLPCLEDFALADEYSAGSFSIERNLFLSIHSGLGIDTYPIGIDESPERVLAILELVRALSARYQKPLSARFVSDGTARIGDHTEFGNQYLKDVVIRPLTG